MYAPAPMNARQFSPDVLEFLRLLDKHAVKYLLIGGYAVFYHGYPRLTANIDFAYDPAPDNADKLYRALLEFWGGSVPVVRAPADLTEVGTVFQFGRAPNRIDLLSRVDGIDFIDAWSRRVVAQIEGDGAAVPVAVISLGDLRSAKVAAGRPKDLDDLENLPR